MHPFHKRLLKEFKSLNTNPLPGIKILNNSLELDKFEFEIHIHNQLYHDKFYKLLVLITKDYPTLPPKVKFVVSARASHDEPGSNGEDDQQRGYKIPIHPHIYTNGHICLNLLGDDWTPACTIESILISLQSMINTNTLIERPQDDDKYIKHAGEYASKYGFVYHDDSV